MRVDDVRPQAHELPDRAGGPEQRSPHGRIGRRDPSDLEAGLTLPGGPLRVPGQPAARDHDHLAPALLEQRSEPLHLTLGTPDVRQEGM